jgi:hypothetical protein
MLARLLKKEKSAAEYESYARAQVQNQSRSFDQWVSGFKFNTVRLVDVVHRRRCRGGLWSAPAYFASELISSKLASMCGHSIFLLRAQIPVPP